MTEGEREVLSEEEAARVWARAAQLQAKAAGEIKTPAVDDESLPRPGYALTHVRSAALEAGIGAQYVEAAIAGLRAERRVPQAARGGPLARGFLGNPPDVLSVQRLIEATPQAVLSAMESVFAEDAYRLTLTDQQGDPLTGGMLVFGVPSLRNPWERGLPHAANEIGMKQLFVSLRTVDGPAPTCEMTIHGPVTTHNIGFGVGMFLTSLAGAAGGFVFGVLGLAAGIAPFTAAGGVMLGGGLGAKGFRALYGFALRRARTALEGLVGTVAARAKGGWRGGQGA